MKSSAALDVCLRRLGLVGLAAAAIGGIGCAYGYQNLPQQFFPAYLTAFFYWLSIALGCLGVTMLHGLTGGGWGRAIRRVVEAGYQTFPLLALLFAPIWLNVKRIYEWTDPDFVQRHEALARKAGYLNVDGFHTRAIVYFAVWISIGFFLDLSSPNDERDPDSPRSRRLQGISGLGFIVYGVTLTLASVDWVMSLEPEWYSTMYGVLYLAGQAVAGLSFALVTIVLLADFEPWSRLVTADKRHDLGNLLLSFVMFWAYVAFLQYLIIWSGNLPEENVWYLHRSRGGWQYLVAGLMGLHFAVPFLLLLSRRMKRQATGIVRVATLLLVMRYVDLYWLMVPGSAHGPTDAQRFTFHWLDVAAFVAIGGAWLALFAWRLSVRSKLPLFDADMMETVDERSGHAAIA